MRLKHVVLPLWLCAASSCVTKPDKTPESDKNVGIDLSAMDKTVPPEKDFYDYANGQWLKTFEIPADKSSWGSFYKLRFENNKRVKAMLIEALDQYEKGKATGNQLKVAKFYKSYMDTKSIDSAGLEPIKGYLAEIDGIKSYKDLASFFAKAQIIGINTPYGTFVVPDMADTTKNTLFVSQSGLGLPDREYYLRSDPKSKKIQEAYHEYLTSILALHKAVASPKAATKRIYDLETTIAKHHWTRVQNRQLEKIYNMHSKKEAQKLSTSLQWPSSLATITNNMEIEKFSICQPSYFKQLDQVITSTPLGTWKEYLKAKTISGYAKALPKGYRDAHFAFYGKTLKGLAQQQERWEEFTSILNEGAGELVGQIYVDKYFPPQAKARMKDLIVNLRAAYEKSIKELEWMGPETKKEALAKLNNIIAKIGYPDEWEDYSNLKFEDNKAVANLLRLSTFAHQEAIAKLAKPVDNKEWEMAPQIVNAYYHPLKNEIVFPAGILQPPFFDHEGDDAANYGAIGAVIGHELGHAFDDQGRKTDADGKLRNWWTKEDEERFKKRSSGLVEQFSKFEPLDGKFINGELTLGENIGDLGGISIAYKAYKISLGGKPSEVKQGLTGEQRFFISFAQAFQGKIRDEALSTRLDTDPHSPTRYRVIGIVPHVPGFYDAFDVKPGDPMYIEPANRVKIW